MLNSSHYTFITTMIDLFKSILSLDPKMDEEEEQPVGKKRRLSKKTKKRRKQKGGVDPIYRNPLGPIQLQLLMNSNLLEHQVNKTEEQI